MLLSSQERQIEEALEVNLQAMKEAFVDLLAGLVLVVIVVVSLLHSVVRLVFVGLGLVLWALALLHVILSALRSWFVAQSIHSIHQFK